MAPRRPYLQPSDPARTARTEQAVSFFNGRAWETGTSNNQESAWRCYSDSCTSHGFAPSPVTYKTLGCLAVTCRIRGNKHSYLKTMVSNLKTHCIRKGIPWLNPAEEVHFKFVTRGLAKFNPSPTKRKRPITKAVLEAMMLSADLGNLKDFQTITMAYLAHDALLRGRELMNLQIQHLRWDPSDSACCTITVEGSKCNKDGPAEDVTIYDYGSCSGVSLLKQYAIAMDLHMTAASAPLFPLIVKRSGPREMDILWSAPHIKDDHFVPAIKALLHAAGFAAADYSGHSFRAGGATVLWTAGSAW